MNDRKEARELINEAATYMCNLKWHKRAEAWLAQTDEPEPDTQRQIMEDYYTKKQAEKVDRMWRDFRERRDECTPMIPTLDAFDALAERVEQLTKDVDELDQLTASASGLSSLRNRYLAESATQDERIKELEESDDANGSLHRRWQINFEQIRKQLAKLEKTVSEYVEDV